MRRRLVLLLALVVPCAPASAAPVLRLDRNGHVERTEDPSLPATDTMGAPLPTGRARTAVPPAAHARAAAARRRAPERTYLGELRRLRRAELIPAALYVRARAAFTRAVSSAARLGGTPGAELAAVVGIAHGIAARGALAASRLPVLTLTLERNRQWWTAGRVPSAGDRIEFDGSEVVWEYYPGRGLQLQVLGSFGKADGLYTAGPGSYDRLRALLGEMVPLATDRGGGVTWEYYFPFDGGSPPWTSAMSQGTAIEALTRAYMAFGDASYLRLARRALSVLHRAPPVGVSLRRPGGRWYLLYSFAPGALVVNGFLQTLIGLYDYAHVSGDRDAAALFAAGDAVAQRSLPSFDTGAWSLYQPGEPDTLDYHQLVTGFLQQLCDRTRAGIYCSTAENFREDMTTPPAITLDSRSVASGRTVRVRFSVSKPAHVGIILVHDGRRVFLTSADFTGGPASFSVPPLDPGHDTVRLGATDLPGNFARIEAPLTVTP